MSLSFVVPKDEWGKHKAVGSVDSAKNDEIVFAQIEKEQAAKGNKIKEYQFDMKQVEAFRYRMEDALRAVTKSAIKEARIKELKAEILNSQKLKVSSHHDVIFPTINSFCSGTFRRQST
jgi:ATP-dependent RNA helicase DDX56/DBP9